MNQIASEFGLDDYDDLLIKMDRHYAKLVEAKCGELIAKIEPFEARIDGITKYYAPVGTDLNMLESMFGEDLEEKYNALPGLISFISKEVIEEY